MVKDGVPPPIAKVAVERAKQIRDEVGMVSEEIETTLIWLKW